MNTMDAIMSRRSCRQYRPEQITKEELEQVLKAAYAAPNADAAYEDTQLTVVQSPEALMDITEIYRKATGNTEANPLYSAPTFIIISTPVPEGDPVGYSNAGCIVENMALAAEECGLGSVYIYGLFDDLRLKENEVLNEYLGLTDGKKAISGIVLGYSEKPAEKREITGEKLLTVYL